MPKENYKILDKRQKFLLLFTKELIIHSGNKIAHLENIIKEEREKGGGKRIFSETKTPEKEDVILNSSETEQKSPPAENQVQEAEKQEPMTKSILSSAPRPPVPVHPEEHPKEGLAIIKPVDIPTPRREIPEPKQNPRPLSQVLKIPEPKLPPEFQYLKPVPLRENINLGKLNPLIQDRAIQVIECEGPERQIIVSGAMGRKPSNITLSEEEIKNTIQTFSAASKIPADTGVYKVVVGRLIFSAIISDVVPSRFMIRKMQIPRQGNQSQGIFPGTR